MTQPEVLTLGRVIVDLYAAEVNVPLSEVNTFKKYLGGSAANTAVGLARLGAKAGLISRVGNDEFGVYLKRRLKEEQVDTHMVATDPSNPTGLAFAALFPPSDSDVLFYRKPCADANIALADLNPDIIREARILVVACTALATSPGREAALQALRWNRASGGLNVLDIDWRAQFWKFPEEAGIYYELALQSADVVLANQPELEVVGRTSDPDAAAQYIQSFGVSQVVAKRGGEGCMYYGPEGFVRVPQVNVEVLNTLGAGDGFGAAYVYGLLQNWDAERRLRFASAAGAIVVSRHSCSEAMPYRSEVEALLG